MTKQPIHVRDLGLVDYATCFEAMKAFNASQTPETVDEIWHCQHPPVYTQGLAGKPEHLKASAPTDIPVIQTDRGGQITYHGPGQLLIYPLLNLKRSNLNAHEMVSLLEDVIIDVLQQHGLSTYSDPDARGIYVDQKKIAALGLRIKRGYLYHGLALNVAMDLTPFGHINPCGYPDLEVTQCSDHKGLRETSLEQLTSDIIQLLIHKLHAKAVLDDTI